VCLEVCYINHHSLRLTMFHNRHDNHQSEDALLAPTLPASVKRRVRAISCMGIAYLNPLRLRKNISFRTRLSSTRGIPRDFGKKGWRRAICASRSQKSHSCHSSIFRSRDSGIATEINAS
jgi:hypothetical protein